MSAFAVRKHYCQKLNFIVVAKRCKFKRLVWRIMGKGDSNNMRIPESRPLRAEERHLLARLLAHGTRDAAFYSHQLPDVSVVSRCGCGCLTIDLAVDSHAASHSSPTTILAEGGGTSPEGIRILHGAKVSFGAGVSHRGEGQSRYQRRDRDITAKLTPIYITDLAIL